MIKSPIIRTVCLINYDNGKEYEKKKMQEAGVNESCVCITSSVAPYQLPFILWKGFVYSRTAMKKSQKRRLQSKIWKTAAMEY